MTAGQLQMEREDPLFPRGEGHCDVRGIGTAGAGAAQGSNERCQHPFGGRQGRFFRARSS